MQGLNYSCGKIRNKPVFRSSEGSFSIRQVSLQPVEVMRGQAGTGRDLTKEGHSPMLPKQGDQNISKLWEKSWSTSFRSATSVPSMGTDSQTHGAGEEAAEPDGCTWGWTELTS